MESYKVIGVMSGTSLDGIDIAYCSFEKGSSWSGKILEAVTVPYPNVWHKKLQSLVFADAKTLAAIAVEYGHFTGKQVHDFIVKHNLKPELVCSHGHTIFHQPQKGFTLQIGDGNAIASQINLPVVYDFRSLDVALGGQGAPLVPIGDRHLFGDYTYCLNLGGIANVSYEDHHRRLAFDICPVNMILNYLAEKTGHSFDKGGAMAKKGKLDHTLLNSLNALEYYKQQGVKTLGREWFDDNIIHLLDKSGIPVEDLLRTTVEHIALQISLVLSGKKEGKLMITGGGARNTFLVERIKELIRLEVVVPDEMTIDYKEAYIFAFLGVLRIRNEVNCLSSVTGASRDSCSGALIQ